MTELDHVFQTLKERELIKSQYEFSRFWLGKALSYYSWLKASKASPSIEAMTKLYIRLQDQIDDLRDTSDCPLPEVALEDADHLEAAQLALWNLLHAKCAQSPEKAEAALLKRI